MLLRLLTKESENGLHGGQIAYTARACTIRGSPELSMIVGFPANSVVAEIIFSAS